MINLRKLFWWTSKPEIHADINDIFHRFQIRKNLKADPNAHIEVLKALGRYSLRSGHQYGPSHSFYSNPDNITTLGTNNLDFLENSSQTYDQIQLSSSVKYTEEQLGQNKRSFAFTINKNAHQAGDLKTSMIFAMYGTYNKNGEFTAQKILAPSFNNSDTSSALISIEISKSNVELALLYAEECALAIYNKENILPWQCMNIALERCKNAPKNNHNLEP